jgi:hypothetical protein
VLALSAASFIYIAVSDLIPRLHRTLSVKESLRDGVTCPDSSDQELLERSGFVVLA